MRRLALLGLGLIAPAGRAQPAAPPPRAAMEALWYAAGNGDRHLDDFIAHANRISIIAPQTFAMDSLGAIRGTVSPRLVAAAREHHVKLVPLIVNPGFNQPLFHHVLTNAAARRRAIHNLTALCRDNHFDGLQFDFENIHVSDKDAVTRYEKHPAAP